MYDAFKYLEPMARLVANEGVDANAAPEPQEGWLVRVIRVLRRRPAITQPVTTPSMTVVRSAIGPSVAQRTGTAA
jgi:hypothetical protein